MDLRKGTKVYFRIYDKSEKGRIIECELLENPIIEHFKEGNFCATANIAPVNKKEINEDNFDQFWAIPIHKLYTDKFWC